MTWLVQKLKPIKGKLLTATEEEVTVGDKEMCEDALRRLGEMSTLGAAARRELRRIFYEMYGEEIMGESVMDTLARLSRDMEHEKVWVEDGRLCTTGGCTDLRHFYLILDEYHRVIAEKTKAIRHAMSFCRGVKPSKCQLQTASFIGAVRNLEELGINPKRAVANIKAMALADDPTLPEAVQKYIDYKVAKSKLVDCARREYGMIR